MSRVGKYSISLLIAALFALGAGVMCSNAASYYVDPNGSDSNGGSQASPFETITYAATIAKAGDTVYVDDGTYPETIKFPNSGTSGAPITFEAVNMQGAKIDGTGNNTVNLDGQSYINIIGFEVTADQNSFCIVSTGGSHTIVENNLVHDCGASGIQLNQGDYRTIQGNTVYRCAFYSDLDGSGISIYEPVASDSALGFHNVVANNISYANNNLAGAVSDGEGIIIDDTQHTQDGGTPYTEPTLVQNNLVYGNGGMGIKAYYSDYVTVRNNTSYWNHLRSDQYTWWGELGDEYGANNVWVNNIAWADPVANGNNVAILDAGNNNANNIWANNLTYNGAVGASSINVTGGSPSSVLATAGNLLGVNPLLANPQTSGTSNFQLQAASPAINAGTSAYGIPNNDLAGNPRPVGIVDIGAYEYQGSPSPTPSPTPTPKPSPSLSPTPTATPSPTPSASPTVKPTPSPSATPAAPAATPSPTPTAKPTPTLAPAPSPSPTPSPTPAPTPAPAGARPWSGAAATVPGIIQMENYDLGGQKVAYADVNNGGQTIYRSDNTGVYSDTGASNGYAVGWNIAGEWMAYTINVVSAGTYDVSASVASGQAGGTFHLEFGPVGQVGGSGVSSSGEFTVPNTGTWSGSYQAISIPAVTLKAGTQWMRLVKDGPAGSWEGNFDYLSFAGSPSAVGPTPFGGTASAVPGLIEVENYDNGGEGVAYHDVNNGGQTDYRDDNIGVYADSSASNGYAVGWNIVGEWTGYTINVATARSYTITARVASGSGGGTFHVEFGPVGQVGGAGVTATAEFAVPNTGGWGGSAYSVVTLTGVSLSAGQQWMRLVKDSGPGGWVGNLDYLNLQ